ncbi:MAG: AAA family ATPase [Pseudomonadota bacterium]|nr:AAA family ATPase [Pseudomonadota bacterium]
MGKTTLAQAYAEEHGVKFVQTGAAATFERLGMDPKKDYDFATRLKIQREILADCNTLYDKSGVRFITDRTPIDFLGYTLADVTRENVRGALVAELERYVTDCYACANQHFTTIVLVQPGIVLIEAEGKAPANPPYMEHLNALMLGLMASDMLLADHYKIPRQVTELEMRIMAVEQATRRSRDRHVAKMGQLHEDGLVLH